MAPFLRNSGAARREYLAEGIIYAEKMYTPGRAVS